MTEDPVTSPEDLGAIEARFTDPASIWWRNGHLIGPGSQIEWIHLFARDGFECVYCGTNLRQSTATLAVSTRDHLVPRCLAVPRKGETHPLHRTRNVVACCANCNSLKGDWTPGKGSSAWMSRSAYIQAARAYVTAEAKAYRKYSEFVNDAPADTWLPKHDEDLRRELLGDREDLAGERANLGPIADQLVRH